MKTRFNLATSPLENNRRFLVISSVIGIVAVAALVFLSMHIVQARRANGLMRADIAHLQSRVRTLESQQEQLRVALKSSQNTEAMDRAKFLNGLIEQRAFPWTKMFADLERILPPGVRVVSISPTMDKEGHVSVELVVGAENDEQKIKFLQAIVNSPVFSHVEVGSETRPRDQQGTAPQSVLLTLKALYAKT